MATLRERHPEVFVEKNEDPRKRERTVPMEVLSLGMSRTGTMTMKAAYEILGIPTWHLVTQSENPPDMAMWVEAMDSKWLPNRQPFSRPGFDNLLGSWGAVTDQPASIFAEELNKAYPEAKIVLVERDVDRWYRSYDEAVIGGTANPFIPLIACIDKIYIAQMSEQMSRIARHQFGVKEERTKLGILNNKRHFEEWREKAKDVYLRHNEMVKNAAPKDRLLVFRLEEGWEPLCKFLGKPVPNVPFPRVNETQAAQEMVNTYIMQGYKRWTVKTAKRAAPVVAIIVAAWSLWR